MIRDAVEYQHTTHRINASHKEVLTLGISEVHQHDLKQDNAADDDVVLPGDVLYRHGVEIVEPGNGGLYQQVLCADELVESCQHTAFCHTKVGHHCLPLVGCRRTCIPRCNRSRCRSRPWSRML